MSSSMRSWLRNVMLRRRVDVELDAEVRGYLELLVDEKVADGMSVKEARRMAKVELGGEAQVKQAVRDGRAGSGFESFVQDVRFAFRTLGRDKAFTLIAVLILAVGIGGNIAVFSVVNGMLLRPLGFRDPEQLVWMEGNNGQGGLGLTSYQVGVYEEFARLNRSFATVTAFVPYYELSETRLTGNGDPKPISGVWVAGDFFQTLGVQPMLGRPFTQDEAVNYNKGGKPAVILSYTFWQRQFHADPEIVGKLITINNRATPVVGVLPQSFDFGGVFAPGQKMDYFVPIIMDSIERWGHMLSLVGRLKPGVTLEQAQAEARVLLPPLQHGRSNWETDVHTAMTGLKAHVSGKMRRPLEILWGAAGLILLIVCVNLSSLLLVRSAARSKEFALRVSLGAGRGRLMRQLLTESLVLSSMGAVAGLGIAYAATGFLVRQGSVALPLLSEVRVDGTALGWTVLMATVVGLVFGLMPGIRVSSGNVQELLKDGGHAVSGGGRHERLRSALVISEIALACLLLVGAGLLLRSFLRVMDTDLGFEPSHAAAIRVDYEDDGNAAKRGAVLSEMLRRVSALPGVESAAISDALPLDRTREWDLMAKGRPRPAKDDTDAYVSLVTPGFLEAMGMHLRAGRDFDWHDDASSERVILINEAAARREWPGEDPVGKLAYGIGEGTTRVIGVVADVRESSVETRSSPAVYVPITQGQPDAVSLVVRSRLPAGALAAGMLRTLRTMNPKQPTTELQPLDSFVERATSPRRFVMVLVGIFAGFGWVLASLGIYGVIAYSVAQRTREIGIRMALGASAGQVQRGVMGKTLRLAAVGIAAGTVTSFVMARAMAALLFGTAATDLPTYVGMVGLLGVVALVAGYVPARRASRIDPAVALRV